MRIILASKSPRRRELLAQIGLEFEIIPAQGEEIITEHDPAKVVRELSMQKAREIAGNPELGSEKEPCMIIGADTVVASEGEILGKPKNETDACRMLKELQGWHHSVFTGVTLIFIKNGEMEELSFSEETIVTFYEMSEDEIKRYVETGEPMDKAGAYGIQGLAGAFVKGIQGDYNNVVGLPVARIYQEIKKRGW